MERLERVFYAEDRLLEHKDHQKFQKDFENIVELFGYIGCAKTQYKQNS